MREELDKLLVEKFPKLFRDRYAPMTETCMCWGFCCGDGWFGILDTLCANIQNHIDWRRSQRAYALRYNRSLKRALKAQSIEPLLDYYTRKQPGKPPYPYQIQDAEQSLNDGKYRDVPEYVHQVVVVQVKEKFGTLRFYYNGGDATVEGMVRMAESMSACICEKCGASSSTKSRDGWVTSQCDSCLTELDKV